MTQAQHRRLMNEAAFFEGNFSFPGYECEFAEELQIEVEQDPSPLGAIVGWAVSMLIVAGLIYSAVMVYLAVTQ